MQELLRHQLRVCISMSMMDQLRAMGITMPMSLCMSELGTFQPVRVENIADHSMHRETFYIPQDTIDAIQQAKAIGRAHSRRRYDIAKSTGILCIVSIRGN
jgi:hypothetical protein